MTHEWKVGDNARAWGFGNGCGGTCWFRGELVTVMAVRIGMIGIQTQTFSETYDIHPRNLDPVLPDERTGKPRPPLKDGEEMNYVEVRRCRALVTHGTIIGHRTLVSNPSAIEYRHIERRVRDLGREARKEGK